MGNVIAFVILIGILASCGSDKKSLICPECDLPTEVAFVDYIQYVEDTTGQEVTVSIRFADLKDRIAGACYRYIGNRRKVLIDQPVWNYLTELERQSLIFHEIGHCVFNKHHNFNYFQNDYCPVSFMAPSIPSHACLEKHWDEYIQEF